MYTKVSPQCTVPKQIPPIIQVIKVTTILSSIPGLSYTLYNIHRCGRQPWQTTQSKGILHLQIYCHLYIQYQNINKININSIICYHWHCKDKTRLHTYTKSLWFVLYIYIHSPKKVRDIIFLGGIFYYSRFVITM